MAVAGQERTNCEFVVIEIVKVGTKNWPTALALGSENQTALSRPPEAMAVGPEEAGGWIFRNEVGVICAGARCLQGDSARAIRELEAERKINPMSPDVYDRLGDAYVRSGEWTKAQEALNRAVLLEPQATGPFILLGETFLKLNEPIEALHYLDHAARMDPSNYITHNLLGQAYRATGQKDAANREFQMVVDLQHGAAAPAEK